MVIKIILKLIVPKNMKIFNFINYSKLTKEIKKADLLLMPYSKNLYLLAQTKMMIHQKLQVH